MVSSRLTVVVTVSCLLISLFAGVSAATSEYDITVESGEVTVPERTVSVGGQQFTVTSVAPVAPDSARLPVRVSAPAGGNYDVILYNNNPGIEQYQPGFQGSNTTVFGIGNLPAGTYAIVADTREVEAVQPVVIEAYETTLSVPETVPQGERFTADISLSGTTPAPAAVDVVIANASVNERIRATAVGSGAYTAEIPAGYAVGEYRVYAAVRNSTTTGSASVTDILSMSGERTVRVTATDEPTDQQNTTNTTPTEVSSSTTNASNNTTAESSTEPASPKNATNLSDSVMQNGTDTTTDETPGFGILSALGGMLIAMLLAWWRCTPLSA